MSFISSIMKKIIEYTKKQDHIKYARSIGVTIGDKCKLTDNPQWGAEPWLITIGNHVLISGQVSFLCHDGATWLFREEGKYKDTYKFNRIVVGNNCFIGIRSIILPGVTIGDNCIVGAGSVVTKNIPSGEVWAGNPARFITKTEDFAKKCYDNRLPYDIDALLNNTKYEQLRVLNETMRKSL